MKTLTRGYPLSYSLFNGSQYEGYTMLPVVEDFVRRFKLERIMKATGLDLSVDKVLSDVNYNRLQIKKPPRIINCGAVFYEVSVYFTPILN